MRIIVEHNGKVYESEESSDMTADEMKTAMYENFDDFTKLEMKLSTGGYLILGRDAVQMPIGHGLKPAKRRPAPTRRPPHDRP